MTRRILATEVQERSMLAAIRCLREAGYRVTGAATTRLAPGLWSRACAERRVLPDPMRSVDGFVAGLEALLQEDAHDLLVPGTDATLLLVSRYRDRLSPYVQLGLPDHAVVERALDKSQIAGAAAEAGLTVPDGHVCERLGDAMEAARALGYPVVVKPVETVVEKEGRMLRRASQLVGNEVALEATAKAFGPCIVQRRVAGNVLSFGGVLTSSGLLGFAVSRYLRTWPPEAGNVSFSTTISPPDGLAERVERLVSSFRWEGIFELELIERLDGSFAAIDFNPRPYGSLSLAVAAGAPLPALWCDWLLGTDPRPATVRSGARYRWEDAELRHFLEQIRRGSLRSARDVLEPHRDVTHAYFDARDPVPAIARGLQLAVTGPSRIARTDLPSRRAPRRAKATNPPAIVLGGGVTALSVARSLAGAGISVNVLDHQTSPARVSRDVERFVDVGIQQPQEEMLASLRSATAGAVLLAGSDDGVELIGRHREELLAAGHHPVEAIGEVLLAMLDKVRTYELAAEAGISVPRIVRLRSRDELEAAIGSLPLPCVLKPVHSHRFARAVGGGGKVAIARSVPQLRAEWERLAALGVEVFATDVIYGHTDEFVSYHAYLDEGGEPLAALTKSKLRQYPPGFGTGTYHQTTDDADVAELGLRFLRSSGVRGLGNVEFKRDERGKLTLIECNPRFTLSNQLIRAAGVDLALVAYNRALGRPIPAMNAYRIGLRLWDPVNDARAFVAYRRLGELCAREWVTSLAHRQCFPTFRMTDPLPALTRARWMARNARTRMQSGRAALSTRSVEPGRRSSVTVRIFTNGAHRQPVATSLIERIGGSCPRGRALAAGLDLVRAAGIGPVWRRVLAERHLSELGPQAREALYERIWTEAAGTCSADIARLGPGLLELSRDGTKTRVHHQTVELDDPVTLQVALDKALVQRLMSEAGLSPCEGVEWTVDCPAAALGFLAQARGPCVVKPAAGTGGGYGVTPGIETPSELLRARRYAAVSGERLLIQRQADGDVYRLLFLDGELLDVVRSVPASLTGDGRATVEQLIARENARRVAAQGNAGLSLLGINLDAVLTLRRTGLRLSSVVPAGERVVIRATTNNNAAEDNETWRNEVSGEVIAAARAATRAVGLRLAGVDVITPDVAKPLEQTGGIITEVNGTPGLHHHYLVADPGSATRVAVPILERLLSGAR